MIIAEKLLKRGCFPQTAMLPAGEDQVLPYAGQHHRGAKGAIDIRLVADWQEQFGDRIRPRCDVTEAWSKNATRIFADCLGSYLFWLPAGVRRWSSRRLLWEGSLTRLS
jgi:L-alanine-DL-glutamate epimerase-like enolase superfamily enzyme